jgi:hypothetical protein
MSFDDRTPRRILLAHCAEGTFSSSKDIKKSTFLSLAKIQNNVSSKLAAFLPSWHRYSARYKYQTNIFNTALY